MSLNKSLLILLILPLISWGQDSISTNSNSNFDVNQKAKKIKSAPVVLESDTLFFIYSAINAYPVELRAKQISERLNNLTEEYNVVKDSVYLKESENFIKVMFNDQLAFVTTRVEANISNIDMYLLAEQRMVALHNNLNSIESLSPKEWLKRIGFFALSLALLIGFIKLINWLFRRLNVPLSKIEKSFLKKNRNILKYFIPKDTVNIFVFLAKAIRIALIVIILLVYAPFMFSFFPFAEHIVNLFYGYISKPVNYIVFGFIDFIPSMFFIVIIAYVARYIVRVLNDISSDVEIGKFKIKNFHKDWAKPTGKIMGLFIYAMSLVLIFPYLPGSGSSAFQGVSIFIGAIISFGSTSAISNIIAGVVITYMRPFQIGDRVKIDNIVGDVLEKTILVTHLRTTKNEDVTIPNANILIGNITNYSQNEEKKIILHTTITLGYDLPWQKSNELLLKAANKTQYVEKKPIPFVLQTSLDDYYVSYELNVYTQKAKKMPFIYSEIHKNILEVFNEAGVEILSPAYISARDGNLTTVPSQSKQDAKGPIVRLVDHLTGRNQKVKISKPGKSENQ